MNAVWTQLRYSYEILSKELWKQKFGTEDIFWLKSKTVVLIWPILLLKILDKNTFFALKPCRDINNINAFHRFINYDFWKSVDTLFSRYLPFIWLSVISMILIGLCVSFSFLYWARSNSLLLDDLLENIFSFFYLIKH